MALSDVYPDASSSYSTRREAPNKAFKLFSRSLWRNKKNGKGRARNITGKSVRTCTNVLTVNARILN